MDNVFNPDSLFEQMGRIVKADAYDILREQQTELLSENARLKEMERSFYMDICRAYNAGKQNMINIGLAKGSPDEGKMFISSHEYFLTEFPTFKTNVP